MPPLMRRRRWVKIQPWYYTQRKPSERAREKRAWRRAAVTYYSH